MITNQVFFDLDGTITDPRDGIVRCIAHALTALGRQVPNLRDLERFIGPPLAQTFRGLLGTTDDAVIRSAIDAYRDRFTSTGILENRVYPDVPAALAELTERGFMLYLLTSKPHVFATRIVDHFGLSAYFARIYGPELGDLDGTKISLLRRALMREKLELRTAVVVGDRKEDVMAARENGVRSVGVTWGYGSREELEGAGAEEIVDSVLDLVSTLGAV